MRLGWKDDDFLNPYRRTYFRSSVGEPVKTPEERAKEFAVQKQGRTSSSIDIPNLQDMVSNKDVRGSGTSLGIAGGMPMSAVLTPQEQMDAQAIVKDPNKFIQERMEQQKDTSWVEQGKSLMSRVFDYEDPVKETAIESVWDKMLGDLFWTYDKINQAGTYGYTKAEQYNPTRLLGYLDGGKPYDTVQELTWEESAQVSPGQAAVTAGAQLARQTGSVFPDFMAGLNPANNPSAQKGFDILDPAQIEAAFVDDLYGKLSSGTVDAVFTVFTDPLIYTGVVGKVARIKYVDRPIVSQAQLDDLAIKMREDATRIKAGENPKTTQGQFIKWALTTDDAGNRVRKASEIAEHPTIKYASNRDQLVYLFRAVQNPDDAVLAIRAAYGDIGARKILMETKTNLAFEIGNAEKNLISTRIAFNPGKLDKQQRKYDRIYNQKNEAYLAAKEEYLAGRVTKQQVDDLWVEADRALSLRKSIDDIDIRSVQANPVTRQEVELTKKDFRELLERDEWLRKALDDDITGSFKQGYKTFSKDNQFGLMVERSRERRAVTAAQMRALPAAPWSKQNFKDVGFLNRSVNLWRWAWQEKPSGQVFIKGVSANEQGREIQALLNSVNIYGGLGVERVIGGKTITVGGLANKEAIYETYIRTVGGSLKDQNQMALVLDGIETRIMNDIGAFHNLPAAEVNAIKTKASFERNKVLSDIKERGFFYEELPAIGGGKELVQHKVPYLDSQLQNSTYMLNFAEFNKLAARRAKALDKGATPYTEGQLSTSALDPIGTSSAAARNFATENLSNLYNAYNNFWRPVTLLRLGYTQRNAAEGLFRASAYTGSLMPLGGASMQVKNSIRNAVVKRAVNRDIRKMSVPEGATAMSTDRFKKWRNRQEEAIEYEIAEQKATIRRTEDQLDTVLRGIDTETTRNTRGNLEIQKGLLQEREEFLKAFTGDDIMALSYYRSQGAAKRSVYDGTEMIDGIEYKGAFADPNYASIAKANLSSDPTVKMNLSLRDRNETNFFKAVQQLDFIEVYPTQPEYYAGVAKMLGQVRNSDIGMMVLRGDTPEEIARFLIATPRGKEIAEFVTGNVRAFGVSSGKTVGKGQVKQRVVSKGGFDTSDYDGALGYVETVMARIDQLAPNPKLKELLRKVDVSGDDVKALLDTPEWRASLKPAVGNITVELGGSKKIQAVWRDAINGAFKWAGTMPEDTFVRTPFYGARYASVRNEMIENIRDYYTNVAKSEGLKFDAAMIPLKEITRAHRVAHRRALKDTKDWLYTIERRTNLGHYGEYIFPFITSAQNSTTAVGRLVWKNPALPEYVRLIWQAPDQAGMTDDRGNIVLPIPLGFVPKNIRDTLSLDSVLNIKIRKDGLNVVFPETGLGILPRFGPFAGVPVGLFMQYGFFGLGKNIAPAGYVPDWVENALGKENGKMIWDNVRDYVFGEDRTPSTQTLMFDQAFPAQVNQLGNLIFNLNPRVYAATHEKIRNAEMLRIMANEREQPESMEEFSNEIAAKTKWHFGLRWLGNVLAFTPPQYEFMGEPLLQARRMYDRSIPEDADKAFYENMGGLATLFTLGSLTKNVAGLDPTDEAIGLTAKHPDLVRAITANVSDYSALGAIFNGDPENEYSAGAISYQTITKIPGTSENYRKILDPVEIEKERSRKFGWVKYLQLVEGQDAILAQRGLTTYTQKGAEDLLQDRRDFIEAAKSNPLYSPWYQDFTEGGSSRTDSVVRGFRLALNDQKFMNDMKGNTTFEAAYLYTEFREQMVEAVKQSPFRSLRAKGNKDLADTWDSFRTSLIRRYPKWGIIANRYLNGDEDPSDLGYQWWQFATPQEQENMLPGEPSTIDPSGSGFNEDEEFFSGPF